MNLIGITIGTDTGLQIETNINTNTNTLDGHNHSPGSGTQITPAGMAIISDLPFGNNNATTLRSVRFVPQGAPLSTGADLGCLYESGVDLYYNDGSGNQVQITSGGAVNATSSGISSGSATASFVSSVLVVNAAASTPANIQCGSILLGNNVASSNFITVGPPSALSASYTFTLPAAASVGMLNMDGSGNVTSVDPSSGTISYNTSTKLLSFNGSNITDEFTFNNAAGSAASININNDNIDAVTLSNSAGTSGIGLTGSAVNGYNTLKLDGSAVLFNSNQTTKSFLAVDAMNGYLFFESLSGSTAAGVALSNGNNRNNVFVPGTVGPTGTVIQGNNFSVSKLGTGQYQISISLGSFRIISALANTNAAGLVYSGVSSLSSFTFTVTTGTFAGGLSDQAFTFIAVMSV